MSEHQNARDMLDRAERAAEAGDLASADELLRSAARSQEEELGPLHPDLANTLNNLAIVAERTGRASEAEAFYRRAVAIASASLPSGHPMVVASRQNLEDFCRAHGLSIDAPAVAAGAPPATPVGHSRITGEAAASSSAAPHSSAAPPSVPQPAPRTSQPLPAAPTPGRGSHPVAWTAIGAVVLVTAVLFVWHPWSARAAPKPTPAESAPPPRDAPPARPAPIEPAEVPKATPRRDDRTVATSKPPAPAPTAGAVTAAITQLCRTLSMNGGSWRCDPAGDSVAPGRLALYTRVRSARDTVVVHRWYRGDSLRRSVRLAIQASPTEGYRTYSRQTVDAGDWRVEVRSADGSLLHEQRFAVR